MDKASEWQIYWRIVMPLAKPALVSLMILDSISTWNEFILAQIFLRTESQRTLPAEVLQFQREIRLRNRGVGLVNSLRGMGQGAQPSYWDRLDEIDAPVLLIAGALDRKFVGIAGQMGIRIAGAELSVVPDAGHAVHLERPGEFLESVREFLAECDHPNTGHSQERAQWT